MSYLTQDELLSIGFKSLGRQVLISDKASIYGANRIEIGDNVRIDDYCVISASGGHIKLGSHIHIAVYCFLLGKGGIIMEDYSGLSARVSLFSASDTFDGDYLIGPTMEKECVKIKEAAIALSKYCTIGTGSTVLPGVKMGEGSVLGANSLLIKDTEDWTINSGSPSRKIKSRKKGLLEKVEIMEKVWK